MQTIARGEQLFKSQACYGCHKIEGFSKGNVGPELTYEGRAAGGTTAIAHQIWDPRYKVASLRHALLLRRPQDQHGLTPDPTHVNDIVDPRSKNDRPRRSLIEGSARITNEDIADDPAPARLHRRCLPAGRRGRAGDVRRLADRPELCRQPGQPLHDHRRLQYRPARRCGRRRSQSASSSSSSPAATACHYIGNPDKAHQTGDPKFGKGGVAGPELSWEGTRHSQKWMVEHYKNPQAFVPGSIMPIFPFSDSQRAALSLYDGVPAPGQIHRPARLARPGPADKAM